MGFFTNCVSKRCTNDVFAYKTHKFVVLEDQRLAGIAVVLKVLIVCYVFLFLIIYRGKHLAVAAVDGVNRVTLQYPTEHSCNPDEIDCASNYTSLAKLPYCTQSTEQYVTDKGKQAKKHNCQVVDHIETFVEHPEGVVVPTRIRRYDQARGCLPSSENGWKCNGSPWMFMNSDGTPQDHKGKSKPNDDYFVSDIERFTLLFDHSFQQLGGVSCDDHDMVGYWLDCPSNGAPRSDCTRKSLLCKTDHCPQGERDETAGRPPVTTAGRRIMTLPNGEVGICIEKGDVFALGTLLGLADVGLDETGGFDETFRVRGLTLVVRIVYDNRPKHFLGVQINPWNTPKPYYAYHISKGSSYDFQKTRTFDDPKVDNRTIRTYNGVRLVVSQEGNIASFDKAAFLVTCTSALGLLAVANFVTDFIMLRCLEKANEYHEHKHEQVSDQKGYKGVTVASSS